ncbi:MAG: hypothetical protein NZL96_02735 [Patescibacteria group bacterium]|nr:hypothetical protein [Patescibacteria group bacterium]
MFLGLSLSSIKTEFGWRPYHNPPFFAELYREGWRLVGKDKYRDIKEEFDNEVKNKRTIGIVYGEKTYFYRLMANFFGTKPVSVDHLADSQRFLGSPKVSFRLKTRLKKFLNKDKVTLIFDTLNVPEENARKNSC